MKRLNLSGKSLNRFLKSAAKSFSSIEPLEWRALMSSTTPISSQPDMTPAVISASLIPGVTSNPAQIATTTTLLTPTINRVLPGDTVTLDAMVTTGNNNPLSLWSGGTVTFMLDGVAVGTPVSVSVTTTANITADATESIQIPTLGTHTVTAVFSGATTLGAAHLAVSGSTSNDVVITAVAPPAQKGTVTMSFSDPFAIHTDSIIAGVDQSTQSVEATSHVFEVDLSSDQTLPLSGTVSVYDGDTLIATLPIKNITYDNTDPAHPLIKGNAQFTVSNPGLRQLKAVYSGDDAHDGATQTAQVLLQGGLAYNVRISGPSNVALGDTVTLTATVTKLDGTIGEQMPTGTVTFGEEGMGSFGSATLDASGHATFTLKNVTAGIHSYYATFIDAFSMTGSTQATALGNGHTILETGSIITVNTSVNGYGFSGDRGDLFVAVGDANQQYVAALYISLLNRTPDNAGLVNWAGQLDNGASRQSVVAAIEHSSEYFQIQVQQLYSSILGRNASSAEVNGWVQPLAAGTFSLTDVKAMFLGSDEFYAKAGGTDNYFINQIYFTVFQRQADAPALSNWISELQAKSTVPANRGSVAHQVTNPATIRSQIAAEILNSDEYRQVTVTQYYANFLHRQASATEIAAWTTQLQSQSQNVVVSNFLSSNEFFNGLDAQGHYLFAPTSTNVPGISPQNVELNPSFFTGQAT